MATHSSILAWRIPRTEGPGGLQSKGSQRVRHNRATNTHTHKWSHEVIYQCILICLHSPLHESLFILKVGSLKGRVVTSPWIRGRKEVDGNLSQTEHLWSKEGAEEASTIPASSTHHQAEDFMGSESLDTGMILSGSPKSPGKPRRSLLLV